MHIAEAFIINIVGLSFAFVQLLFTRWLLMLSTWQKDLAWLKRQAAWKIVARAKWYRGTEYFHQLNFIRIMRES